MKIAMIAFASAVISIGTQAAPRSNSTYHDKFDRVEQVARTLARTDKLGGEFELVSLSRHSNPFNRVTMFDMTGRYKAHYGRLLRDKTYWLGCFQLRQPAIGAESCYFIDDKTEKLIARHRGK